MDIFARNSSHIKIVTCLFACRPDYDEDSILCLDFTISKCYVDLFELRLKLILNTENISNYFKKWKYGYGLFERFERFLLRVSDQEDIPSFSRKFKAVIGKRIGVVCLQELSGKNKKAFITAYNEIYDGIQFRKLDIEIDELSDEYS